MRIGRFLIGALLVVVIAAAVVYFGFVRRPIIAALAAPPLRRQFSTDDVKAGARLAALGDCAVCHTTEGGRSFAGGLAVPTPFGVVYSTNITPDSQTGIGLWSEAAFVRSLREGVSRDGSYLYPAFPYDHFTKASDADIRALYAYFMTREPVRRENKADSLVFPISLRPIMAGWNWLFLKVGPRPDNPHRDADWNRGRALAEGLGHCGACHTPRNAFGAEIADKAYDGGEAEGWLAPALNEHSPDPEAWGLDDFVAYLKTGFAADHSFAAGPMGPVTRDMSQLPDSDVHAMAAYLATLQQPVPAARRERAQRVQAAARAPGLGLVKPGDGTSESARLYASACGWCHYTANDSHDFFASRQKLALGLAANAPDPRNLLHVVLDGIAPVPGEPSPIMPGFRGSLTRDQIVSLAAYIRAHFSDQPPWSDIGSDYDKAEAKGQ